MGKATGGYGHAHGGAQVGAASAQVRPDGREYVRLGVIGAALVAGAVAAFAFGWWVPGVLLALLALVFAGGCLAVGRLAARFMLGGERYREETAGKKSDVKRRGNLWSLLFPAQDGPEVQEAAADLAARGLDPDDPAEQAIDRAVGPSLRLVPPADGAFGSGLSAEARARLRTERLDERARTAVWLDACPAWGQVTVAGEDGAELVGHVLAPHAGGARWVLLAHGYRGTWREMIKYARRWGEAGYNLLVVEQRGHGRSGGRYVGMGWLERRDVVSWCRWLVESGRAAGADAAIVLHGHSMGGATVCLASAEPDLPACVCAAVSDCAYSSAWAALSWVAQVGDIPARPLLDLMRLVARTSREGYDLAKADVAAALAKPGLPVLFIHGEEDTLVPPEMTRALHGAANREKRLLMVPGAGHCQASMAAPDAYWDAVLSFAAEKRG